MDQSDQLEAVGRMQNYIATHLMSSISLNDLAKAAGYSPYYSAKLFKKHTDKTPFEYIRLLRLRESSKALLNKDLRVLDVALEFYFNSHEGFTRAFTKAFGLSPKKYQQDKPPLKWFTPYPVTDYHQLLKKGSGSMKDKKSTTIFTQVVEKPSRKLLLKRGTKSSEYFAYCEEVGCDVWGILCSVKEALSEPMGMWLPKALRPEGTSEYIQGVEVPTDYKQAIPEGFELIDLPACKIMIFQGETYDDEIFMEAIGLLQKSISTYDPKPYGFDWDPSGYRFQYEPQGQRGYIEGRGVVAL